MLVDVAEDEYDPMGMEALINADGNVDVDDDDGDDAVHHLEKDHDESEDDVAATYSMDVVDVHNDYVAMDKEAKVMWHPLTTDDFVLELMLMMIQLVIHEFDGAAKVSNRKSPKQALYQNCSVLLRHYR